MVGKVLVLALLIAVMPVAVCEAKGGDDWYGQVEFTSGMLQDLSTGEQDPYVDFPLGGYKAARLRGGFVLDAEDLTRGPTGALLGLTFDLGNAEQWGINTPWAKYISVSVGPFGKYDFESGDFSGGLMASLIEVAFGGVQEQKKR